MTGDTDYVSHIVISSETDYLPRLALSSEADYVPSPGHWHAVSQTMPMYLTSPLAIRHTIFPSAVRQTMYLSNETDYVPHLTLSMQ